MKKILTLIIGLLASGVALPTAAQAGGFSIGFSTIYNNGHHSCGCAIRTKKVVVGYDCYHRPIWRYYNVPTTHRCGHRAHRAKRYYGHNGYYDRGRHYRRHEGRRYKRERTSRRRNEYRRERSRRDRRSRH